MKGLSNTALNELLNDYELTIKELSEILVQELALRDELEYDKELKNQFISLLLMIQKRRRESNVDKKKRRSKNHVNNVMPTNNNNNNPSAEAEANSIVSTICLGKQKCLSVNWHYFLVHQLLYKHVVWVLKRIVSLRRFFWVPTTYVLVKN